MTMIAQIQNLRNFVSTQLVDIIDPSRHVREDQDKKSTGDHAHIEIKTAFNRYKISVASAYVTPPEGAPLVCRSLGTVTFVDLADNKRIVGPKADQTWTDISQHIHLRELGDAIADGRRRLAEAAPHQVAAMRAELAAIAVKAKKWGISAPANWTLEELAVVESDKPPVIVKTSGLAEDIAKNPELLQPGHVIVHTLQGDPNVRAPFVGAPVVWITNPGEGIGGMTEIPGICAKVISRDRISVFVIPDHSEPSYRDNLMRRGSDAGNGRVHQSNCWDFNPQWLAEQERVGRVERDLEFFKEEYDRLKEWTSGAESRLQRLCGELVSRVIALEAAAKRDAKPAASPATAPKAPKEKLRKSA